MANTYVTETLTGATFYDKTTHTTTAFSGTWLAEYDSSGNLLASSISTLDNVQELYLTGLAAGTYEIEVVKATSRYGAPGNIRPADIYALAWDFGR